ncbi:zinc-binding alcohol dehydrogenase family protein [Cognatishimia maritima]|uniref:zinc-binding alcohol dehydrogenase family protein n=1 Tax=Cognatishimia maritima TaxID=870908 RepID=UPI001F616E0E|nr:zinc-binding alcohol dehydrogenase family protein [Cognatishimia maritima]
MIARTTRSERLGKLAHNLVKMGVVEAPNRFEIQLREPETDIPDDWVLIDICAVGLCGTDYHIYQGKHPFLNYPRVIGHELSGRVTQDTGAWKAGDLVVINPYISCGDCRPCHRGKPNCCRNIEVLGVHRDGGMAPQIAVPSQNLYSAIGLSAIQAAMVEFLAIGAHAVRRSEVTEGDRVLVAGIGPIGIGVALFSRLLGAEVTLLDLSAQRLAMAKDQFDFQVSCTSISEAIAESGGDGYDVVFDATGHAGAINTGFEAVAHGGTYVLVSVVKDDITFSDPEFHKREMRLIGSRNALQSDFDWVISAMRDGLINSSALCSSVITLEELAEQMPSLAHARDDLIKVVVEFGP